MRDKIKKTIVILFVFLFVVTVTAGAVSAIFYKDIKLHEDSVPAQKVTLKFMPANSVGAFAIATNNLMMSTAATITTNAFIYGNKYLSSATTMVSTSIIDKK